MRRSESDCSGCKEHPNNRQLPGVCSSCLRDKLSHLYLPSNTKPAHLLPSSSLTDNVSPQPISSAASSNYVSSALRPHHRRNKSDAMDSVSNSMLGFSDRLKKSRSIVFASRSGVGVGDGDVKEGWDRKKDWFWSKLLKLTRQPRRH